MPATLCEQVATLFKWIILGFLFSFLLACGKYTPSPVLGGDAKKNRAVYYNVQLGLGYLAQGDNPRAKKKLIYALKLDSHSPLANNAMAYFYEKTGNRVKAKKLYQESLAYSRGAGAEMNNYGAFLCKQGLYQEADSYFNKASQDPLYLNSAQALENAGLCAMRIPNEIKAQSYFLQALKEDPQRLQSLYELMRIAIKRAQFSAALNYARLYPALVLKDRNLLKLAIQSANKANKPKLKTYYQKQLQALEVYEPNGEYQ